MEKKRNVPRIKKREKNTTNKANLSVVQKKKEMIK